MTCIPRITYTTLVINPFMQVARLEASVLVRVRAAQCPIINATPE